MGHTNMANFETELTALLNKFTMENDSNTPDFILAKFITGCLDTFNEAVNCRTEWLDTPNANPTSTR
jgi:hypothetical protein